MIPSAEAQGEKGSCDVCNNIEIVKDAVILDVCDERLFSVRKGVWNEETDGEHILQHFRTKTEGGSAH